MPDMTLDIVRLVLFPALMAFAAVSDLFTMTISNRISLALLAGFVVLAAFGGMSMHAISMHLVAGLAVLVFAYAAIFGGLLTLAILQFRKWPLPAALLSQEWVKRLHDRDTGVPYGIALAIGALMIYPETEWMKAIDLARFAAG
jgi:prepilin peptidase CpaA